MADDEKDPRESPWHPRRRLVLFGHEEAEARILRAIHSGKLHHAWLLSGPRGVGKATLAYRIARYLAQPPSHWSPGTLAVASGSETARQLAAGAHPNVFVLQRTLDPKTKRLKTEISVDDAREAIGFVTMTSANGGWRIVVVDAADDLNLSSANALLKMVEEPPPRSIVLIVCHNPGNLLRTIRSRCIQLRLAPLPEAGVLRALHSLPKDASPADSGALETAASLSQGSPGRALELISSRGASLFADLKGRRALSPAQAVEIAAAFGGRTTSAEDYQIFCDLLAGWVASQAREAAIQGRGDGLARAHGDIVYSLRQADALNLDRRQTVTDALLRLDEALKAS